MSSHILPQKAVFFKQSISNVNCNIVTYFSVILGGSYARLNLLKMAISPPLF